MKKNIFIYPILLVMMAVMFSGCLVTSVHPLGSEDEIIFDENLLGAWEVDGEFWIFTEGEDNLYKLFIPGGDDNDTMEEFNAALFRLDDISYLDIFPSRFDSGNVLIDVLMLPVHTFVRCRLDGDELHLAFNDPEWFENLMDENIDIGIDYLVTDDEVITLTASTEMLQAFYVENADRPGFFDMDDEPMKRIANIEINNLVEKVIKEKLEELSEEDIKTIIEQLEKAGEEEKALEQKQIKQNAIPVNPVKPIEGIKKNGVERNVSEVYVNVEDGLKEKLAELNEEEVKTLIEQFEKAGETEKALEQRRLLLQLQSFKQENFKEKDGHTIYTFPSQKE